MQLPSEIPVMTLPNVILFPQAMLPLYIYERRYRQMLTDALHSHRMFSIAMQKPGRTRESPSHVAGLGLIRASVGRKDGTSHLILQGLTRIELAETVRYRPYRVQRIRKLETTGEDSVAVDALAAKVLELVSERLDLGIEMPVQVFKHLSKISPSKSEPAPVSTLKEMVQHLAKLDNPDHLADMVSCALLSDPADRQVILESTNLEARLKHLIHFLLAEIKRRRKSK